jgi:hypothetical protein
MGVNERTVVCGSQIFSMSIVEETARGQVQLFRYDQERNVARLKIQIANFPPFPLPLEKIFAVTIGAWRVNEWR